MRFLSLYRFAILVLCLGNLAFAQDTSFLLSPAPEATVDNQDLIVSATVSGPLQESMGLGRARLWVEDREVTQMCLRTDSYLSYRPLTTLKPGPVKVRLEFPNGVVREWQFEIAPTKMIKEVTHTGGKEALGEYADLTVTMKGEPGLKGTFSFGRKRQEYPMEEQSRGVYIGTYTVKPGDYYLGEPVIGHLHLGSKEETLASENPVRLFGHLFRVHIISPETGSKVPLNFPIKGRTRPGSKVSLVPRISFNRNSSPPAVGQAGQGVNGAVGSGEGNIETRADDEGFWQIDYGIPVKLPNVSVVMSVFAISPEGERSAPVTLRYHF